MVEARQRFDPTRGVKFNTFAYYRVRGAIIDGVRAMTYMPRRAHAKLRAAEAADQLGESLSEHVGDMTAQEAAKNASETLAKMTAAYVLASLGQQEHTTETPEQLFTSKLQAQDLAPCGGGAAREGTGAGGGLLLRRSPVR